MFENEFCSPVSRDDAPEGYKCEWCGQPAMHLFIVIGGKRHNEIGRFCPTCSEAYIRIVAESLNRKDMPEAEEVAIR